MDSHFWYGVAVGAVGCFVFTQVLASLVLRHVVRKLEKHSKGKKGFASFKPHKKPQAKKPAQNKGNK